MVPSEDTWHMSRGHKRVFKVVNFFGPKIPKMTYKWIQTAWPAIVHIWVLTILIVCPSGKFKNDRNASDYMWLSFIQVLLTFYGIHKMWWLSFYSWQWILRNYVKLLSKVTLCHTSINKPLREKIGSWSIFDPSLTRCRYP